MTAAEQDRAGKADTVVGEIRRTLWGLVIATLVLFVAIAGVAFYSYTTSDHNRQAVCRLREDLTRRIAASQNFITKHPEQIKQLGFTIPQVQHEVENQERTRAALSVVSCP